MFRYVLIGLLTAFFMFAPPPRPARADVCYEDQPCWDCTWATTSAGDVTLSPPAAIHLIENREDTT